MEIQIFFHTLTENSLFVAVWMLPQNWPYGLWPASGEIDIIESRGKFQ